MKITLQKCDLCAYDHATYDFFKTIDSNFFIISYLFRTNQNDETIVTYDLMKKGHYSDGGIALVVGGGMLYALGDNCFITGYCPLDIEKEE